MESDTRGRHTFHRDNLAPALDMVDSERAVTDETTAGLLEAAGPLMYRRNAFRITGLPTNADRRTVRQRQQRVTPALELGADVDLGHSLPVRPADVRGAFDRILGDPRRRLADELFWLWGAAEASADGTANAASTTTCSCPESLHADHDAAVRAHSAALDLEAESDGVPDIDQLAERTQLWNEASLLWGQVLERTAFWDHVRHRIAELDDRQLDGSVIDTFRDAMPTILVRPLIELAAADPAPEERHRFALFARDWPLIPSDQVEDQLEEAAAPLYESLRATAKRASALLDGGNWDGAAAEVYDHARPTLRLLESLVPHVRHRRTASASNDIAVLLNNCATTAMDALGPAANPNASKWFSTAAELAMDPATRQTIETNRESTRDMAETFADIQYQVDQFVALGHITMARTLLLKVKRQLAGGPGTEEIDRMMAVLRGERPAPEVRTETGAGARTGTGTYSPPRRRGRLLAGVVLGLVILGLLAAMIGRALDDDGGQVVKKGTAVVSAKVITDNSPVGACIEREADWDPYEREVATVPCDRPHWGEVLAYVPLVPTTSAVMTAEYRGLYETIALSQFRCELALRQLVPEHKGLMTKYRSPGEQDWDPAGPELDEYATCVVRRIDGAEMAEGDVVRRTTPDLDVSVPMTTFGQEIYLNAPVGTCIQSRIYLAVTTTEVPVVDCEKSHWAEIVGYPVLYEGMDLTRGWPGDDAVLAKAEAACEKAAADLGGVVQTLAPDRSWWRATAPPLYAMCAVSQEDDRLTVGGLR